MDSVKEKNADPMSFWSSQWTIDNQPLVIEAGDLSLSVSRLPYEWLLHYQWQKRGNSGPFNCDFASIATDTADAQLCRLAVNSDSRAVMLQSKLADRPVIVRPYSPLTIPAQQTITLYVSTPLWLCVSLSGVAIELPVQQLSDTWMGALTGEGSLCYGSQTHARLDKSLLLKLPYRALTPVNINNQGNENFTLERLSIPTPYLSLYEGDGQLTTEALLFEMDAKNHQGSVIIEEKNNASKVSPARESADRGMLTNTWENLFA